MSISTLAVIQLFQLRDRDLTPGAPEWGRAEVVGRVKPEVEWRAPLDLSITMMIEPAKPNEA